METLLEKAEQQANKAITSAEKAWQAAQNAADAAQSASCTEGYINQIAEETVQKAAADIEQKIQDAIELLQSQFKKANETVVSENTDDSVASENIEEQEELEEAEKQDEDLDMGLITSAEDEAKNELTDEEAYEFQDWLESDIERDAELLLQAMNGM